MSQNTDLPTCKNSEKVRMGRYERMMKSFTVNKITDVNKMNQNTPRAIVQKVKNKKKQKNLVSEKLDFFRNKFYDILEERKQLKIEKDKQLKEAEAKDPDERDFLLES